MTQTDPRGPEVGMHAIYSEVQTDPRDPDDPDDDLDLPPDPEVPSDDPAQPVGYPPPPE